MSPTPKKFEAFRHNDDADLFMIEDSNVSGPKPRQHGSASIKTFDTPSAMVPETSRGIGAVKLSTALRRHTVVYQNPIFERQLQEEMD